MLRYFWLVLGYAKRGISYVVSALEAPLRHWFLRCHGKGASNQDDLYRCLGCRGIVTHRMIAKGGCGCGHPKLSPTNPTTLEFVGLMITPWRYA